MLASLADFSDDELDALRQLAEQGDRWATEALAELEAIAEVELLEDDWRDWLATLFPEHTTYGFAPHHEVFWDWVWAMAEGVRPDPLVAIWSRGGAKSTSAEMACVAIGARGARRYGLYLSETQDQADDHVGNVGSLLESKAVARYYPALARRAVNKYGSSKGWRRQRLRTGAGFTIDAIGLDSAARGAKLDEDRPDFLVIDDVDGELDTAAAVEKKITTLTRKIIPAGSEDLAVLAIQNLVHPDSIFARLSDGRADFLSRRIVSGPVPALVGMEVEQQADRQVIVRGEPTWEGQSLAVCQDDVDDWGLSAFLKEAQHEVEAPAGGMFDHIDFARVDWHELPDLIRIVVWVDPAVTDTDNSDSMGIQADGLGGDNRVYRLWSWEQRSSPLDALKRAIAKAIELKADHVGVETDQGGDTWQSVYREAAKAVLEDFAEAHPHEPLPHVPPFTWEKAGAGHGPKTHRASLMVPDYERRRIVHVRGTHEILERALCRFPRTKPLDLVDANYWSWQDLRKSGPTRSGAAALRSASTPSTLAAVRR